MKKVIKKTLLLMLKISVSAGLLFYALKKIGPDKVFDAIKTLGPEYFLAAAVMFTVLIFLTSLRWGQLLSKDIGKLTLFRLQMLGSFFNSFMPGSVGGDGFKVYYLYKQANMGAEAVASIFMDRYLGYAALMTIGFSTYIIERARFAGTWVEWALPALVGFFIVSSLVLFGMEAGRRFKFIAKVYDYFRVYRTRKKTLAKAFGIALAVQSLSVLSVYVIARGMGIDINPVTLVALVSVVATLAAAPISLGGVGIREGAMVMLLSTVNVEPAQAAALAFLWYLSMLAGSAPGALEYMRSKDYIKESFRAQQEQED